MKLSTFTFLLYLEVGTAFIVNTPRGGSGVTVATRPSSSSSSSCLRVSSIDKNINNDVDPSIGSKEEENHDVDNGGSDNNNNIRPLHQNWWPVTTVEALDSGRPNAVQLLGMDLVLFQSDSDSDSGAEEWTCLQDRCSHRFAPLSEGRVISRSNDSDNSGNTKNNLECAYHGWRFDSNGSCERIPQLEEKKDDTKVISYCKVKSFPVRIDCGMVFVWADPETANLGQLIPLPTFPYLKESASASSIYMRDLPYGYELLGENLLDLSHLPFSHHSVGTLKRDMGGPLPFKMLSSDQKSPDMPLYEATLTDAYKTDPLFIGNPKTPKDASLNLGFYQPCHVRYTRKAAMTGYVALFFCPTSETRSRVFLFNLYRRSPPDEKTDNSSSNGNTNTKSSKIGKIKGWMKPSSIKGQMQKTLIKMIFTPVFSHQISHKIFDGDGIFLRMQGDRMQKEGLSYQDYKTPTSADVMVNSFRRYAKTATELTRKAGKESMAEAACSSKGYGKNLSRKDMLDRYESHTKNCKVCSAALKARETKRERIRFAKTIVTGGIGASGSILAMLLLLTSEVTVPTAVVRGTGKIFLGSILASFGLSKLNKKNEEGIQQFLFEDYVHSEKN